MICDKNLWSFPHETSQPLEKSKKNHWIDQASIASRKVTLGNEASESSSCLTKVPFISQRCRSCLHKESCKNYQMYPKVAVILGDNLESKVLKNHIWLGIKLWLHTSGDTAEMIQSG